MLAAHQAAPPRDFDWAPPLPEALPVWLDRSWTSDEEPSAYDDQPFLAPDYGQSDGPTFADGYGRARDLDAASPSRADPNDAAWPPAAPY
jgi:hypothetical protein